MAFDHVPFSSRLRDTIGSDPSFTTRAVNAAWVLVYSLAFPCVYFATALRALGAQACDGTDVLHALGSERVTP